MAAAFLDIRYAQLSLGSIKEKDLPQDFKSGYCFQAARTFNVAREYFLEQTNGLKQVGKVFGVVDMAREWLELPGLSGRTKIIFDSFSAVKKLLTASESYSKLKGILKPAIEFSPWYDDTNKKVEQTGGVKVTSNVNASYLERLMAKGAEIADWTMSAVETHKWLAKVGYVASRAWLNTVFNVASIAFLAHHYKTEGAKWWTGKTVDPLNGKVTDFDTSQKVKSVFLLTILTAYAILTAIAVAEMAGYALVADEAFWTFACLGTAVTCTVLSHFWEKLVLPQAV